MLNVGAKSVTRQTLALQLVPRTVWLSQTYLKTENFKCIKILSSNLDWKEYIFRKRFH